MGLIVSKMYAALNFSQPTRILLLGLDAAGKTTALYKLKMGELVTTIPTIGFNVETVKYKNLDLTIWDVGGQDKIRPLWRHYFEATDALIWIVDSVDEDRLSEASVELHKVLADDCLRGVSILVLANKQDLPRALDASRIAAGLGLHALRSSHDWYISPCSAVSGDGLIEGLEWIHKALRAKRSGSSLVRAG